MKKIKFDDNIRDPFTEYKVHLDIVCDLEAVGKIQPEEAFKRVKSYYKQFKQYIKSRSDESCQA